jgi:hypothetical protein
MSKYFDQANMFMEPDTNQHGSHMVMTNVVKPTKTKYLTIDTRFRDGYDSNTNANYNISLPERVNNVRSMQLRNIEIPMTFYNISCSLGNNTIIFKILNNETTIVIPDNQYDSTTLVAEINSLLTNLGSPFNNIQITISNNKTTIDNTGGNPCIVIFDESASLNPCDSMMSRLGWKLGFRKKSYTLESNINLKSESFVDLHGPRYLFLILDEFKNGNPHSFLSLSKTSQLSSQQILARIAIDYDKYPFGSILPAEQYNYALSDKRRYANEVDLQRFNIRLVDEFGKILDLNGTDVSMCLELEHL